MLGVSAPVAAMRLTRELARAMSVDGGLPDLVLLFGVAGAFPDRHLEADLRARAPTPELGACAWVSRDAFGDLGVQSESDFLDLEALGLEQPGPFGMHALGAELAARAGLPCLDAVTVATGSAREAESRALHQRTGARLESMEGAAVAMVCASFGVPMIQLRSVSNYTGDRVRAAWSLDSAVAAVQDYVCALLPLLAGMPAPT